MTRRALFEVASTLLGVYFIVSAFSAIPLLSMSPRLQYQSVFQSQSIARQLLLWLGPFLYVLAGLCLIAKHRAWARWLFPENDTEQQLAPETVRLGRYFELGVKLLGLNFVVHFLPSAVRVVADAQEKGLVGLDIRGAWATILVLGSSLIMVFKSNLLASLLYAEADNSGAEPPPGSPERQQSSAAAEEPPRV